MDVLPLRRSHLQIGVVFLSPIILYFIITKGMGAYFGNTNQVADAIIATEWDPSHAKAQFNASRSTKDQLEKQRNGYESTSQQSLPKTALCLVTKPSTTAPTSCARSPSQWQQESRKCTESRTTPSTQRVASTASSTSWSTSTFPPRAPRCQYQRGAGACNDSRRASSRVAAASSHIQPY